jgi:tetratricopeptide (TPR) repeat protein
VVTVLLCLTVAGALFMQLVAIRHGPDDKPAERMERVEILVPPALQEDVEAAWRLLRDNPDQALAHIERALGRAADAAPELRALLHTWAAGVYARRGHMHRARGSLEKAIELEANDERRQFLLNVEASIRSAQGERGKARFYLASRGAGRAAALVGRVVVAYLLVDPDGPGRWTDVDRVYARATLARVEQWYAAKANARGVATPEFVERVFEVPLAAGDLPIFPNIEVARRTAWILAGNLGHGSIEQLLGALAAEERADQAMLLVHSPQSARSFAASCTRSSSCEAEMAFIYVRNGPSSWDELAYTIGHEGLHLFGADDLYDVRGAEDYEPTDLMNYPSTRLEYADVGDLTAWAVGWARDRPKTPFVVEE